jgi:hypothetical protein
MVVGWLARIVIVVSIVAILGYDGIQVTMAKVDVKSDASNAAKAGRDAYASSHNVKDALAAARANAQTARPGDIIPASTFTVSQNGSVTLVLNEPIKTIVAHHLPAPSLRTATATVTAVPDPGTEINPSS